MVELYQNSENQSFKGMVYDMLGLLFWPKQDGRSIHDFYVCRIRQSIYVCILSGS